MKQYIDNNYILFINMSKKEIKNSLIPNVS